MQFFWERVQCDFNAIAIPEIYLVSALALKNRVTLQPFCVPRQIRPCTNEHY